MMSIGDKVKESPVGPGEITDFTQRGFPKVNHIAVAWLVLATGETFDPLGSKERNNNGGNTVRTERR